jgi:hypothetical protein
LIPTEGTAPGLTPRSAQDCRSRSFPQHPHLPHMARVRSGRIRPPGSRPSLPRPADGCARRCPSNWSRRTGVRGCHRGTLGDDSRRVTGRTLAEPPIGAAQNRVFGTGGSAGYTACLVERLIGVAQLCQVRRLLVSRVFASTCRVDPARGHSLPVCRVPSVCFYPVTCIGDESRCL